jgi:hypothetical protein
MGDYLHLEIVCSKIQIPSTCLRRSGLAQAGQIPNKLQCSKSKIPNLIWTMEFIWDLDIGFWDI